MSVTMIMVKNTASDCYVESVVSVPYLERGLGGAARVQNQMQAAEIYVERRDPH